MRRFFARWLRRRSRLAGAARAAVAGRAGLEIGGPSRIFSPKGRLPLYDAVRGLDGFDFGAATPRRPGRRAEEGYRFLPDRPPGALLVGEAAALGGVAPGTYGFVLASHVLEHLANPLGALDAWRRVVGDDGALVLVVPEGKGTFDHRRPVTALAHLEEDRRQGTGEDDRTHLAEVLALHDLSKDPGHDTREALAESLEDNLRTRRMHHHVFDRDLAVAAVEASSWRVEGVDVAAPYHIILLARAR